MPPTRTTAIQRMGRDELNLVEFPFALLSDRPSKDAGVVLRFKDGAKEWVVAGDPELGLPSAADVEIYVVLMEITHEKGFPEVVPFCRHDIFRRLGWDTGGKSYDRLMLSLRRLVGVTIRTKNAWYDASQKVWERERGFHILDSYDITDSRQAQEGEGSLFPSWFRWSPELYNNIYAGHIKRLDVGFFLSLRSSISQALYRYLDAKKYDRKPMYQIGLKKLAWEHLGLSRTYSPAGIKRKLDIAHGELLERGYLLGAEYARMKDGIEDKVIYRFPASEREEPVPLPQIPCPPKVEGWVDPLLEELTAAGLSRYTAEQLAREKPEECRRQLAWLPSRKARNPGAVLVTAIREEWAPPPESRTNDRNRVGRTCIIEKETVPLAGKARWEALTEEERERLRETAAALLRKENPTAWAFGQKNSAAPLWTATLEARCLRLLEEQGS